MTSSEYIFRKPCKELFEIALKKSGLSKDEILYCGNSISADVIGARNAGIYPVLFDNRELGIRGQEKNDQYIVDFPYLKIKNWDELLEYLK